MKKILYLAAALLAVACTKEIKDGNVNAYSFKAVAETVREGEDIPVHLSFADAGLKGDNVSWGDEWKKATFHAVLKDSFGKEVENAVYSGPGGILAEGTRVDIPRSGRMDIVIGSLRKGRYTLAVNLRTRYTVDTWATTTFTVDEKKGGTQPPSVKIPVEDFTVPGSGNGMDVEKRGSIEYIILDLRIFNASNPFLFQSTVLPENATDKKLVATSANAAIVTAAVKSGTDALLELVPKAVGEALVTVRSNDGAVTKQFGVKVIRTSPDAEGFTLPTDDGEKDAYDFDLAGRLALDINEWNASNPFTYTCKPIPSNAKKPELKASSDDEAVVKAAIRDGNRLVLTPAGVGYATVTVSTTDGKIVRTMRVAVISKFTIVAAAQEGEPSDEDRKTGVFPCSITFKSDSKYMPKTLFIDVYGKATGRIDLTDPVDYFKSEELKNARSATYSFEDSRPVVYLSNGQSAYDVYTNLQKKVASQGEIVHHSDDWPNYYDYAVYYRLQSITLQVSVRETAYDTNLYRCTFSKTYDSPENRIYQYLH